MPSSSSRKQLLDSLQTEREGTKKKTIRLRPFRCYYSSSSYNTQQKIIKKQPLYASIPCRWHKKYGANPESVSSNQLYPWVDHPSKIFLHPLEVRRPTIPQTFKSTDVCLCVSPDRHHYCLDYLLKKVSSSSNSRNKWLYSDRGIPSNRTWRLRPLGNFWKAHKKNAHGFF